MPRFTLILLVMLSAPLLWGRSAGAADRYDVVVSGGSSAGVAAAVQVARSGKSVVLIEPSGLRSAPLVPWMPEGPPTQRRYAIATYTLDYLAYSLQPPTVAAVLDFEGGGRLAGELTDMEPEKVAIGDELEMTFRRLYTGQGVHNYFWKARPRR